MCNRATTAMTMLAAMDIGLPLVGRSFARLRPNDDADSSQEAVGKALSNQSGTGMPLLRRNTGLNNLAWYRVPASHNTVTIVWPGPSSRARRMAPATLTPLEPPTHQPSSCSRLCVIGTDSSSGIDQATSIGAPSKFAVIRLEPIPSLMELPSATSSPVCTY